MKINSTTKSRGKYSTRKRPRRDEMRYTPEFGTLARKLKEAIE